MKLKSVTITEQQVERITEKAKKYGVTFSDALRRTIDIAFEVEENDENRKNRNLEKKSG